MMEYDELLTLIPHKGKMMLLNRVTDYNTKEKSIEAEYNVTDECIFYDPVINGIPSWTGFEFIAQSVSVFLGLEEKAKGKLPRLGFILGVSQVKIDIPVFTTGCTLKIKAKEAENEYPVIYYTGDIFINDKKVFSGRLTVMDADDEQLKILSGGL